MVKDLVLEKLAQSLTASTTELIPYLPYLLQDLWALGSMTEDILSLILSSTPLDHEAKVLDLACGKGAVSVKIAKTLQCHVKGVDLMPAFIEEAKKKSREHGVEHLCSFSVEDIGLTVERERGYDLVIYGAAGDVLGTQMEILRKIKSVLKPGGFIIMDEVYSKDEAPTTAVLGSAVLEVPTRTAWDQIFNEAGVAWVAEVKTDPEKLKRENEAHQAWITTRAEALMEAFPERAALFLDYIHTQQQECDMLENDLEGVTWLLRVK